MQTLEDYTNVFGFFGNSGDGPGKHTSDDFISSIKLGYLIEVISKIGQLSGYHRQSPEGHISCFYGNLVNRTDGTNIGIFLDSGYSRYGISIDADTTNPSQWNSYFDVTTSSFYLPILPYLLNVGDIPHVTFDTLYGSTVMNKFRPQYYTTEIHDSTYYVYFKLLNCADGTFFSASDYSSLSTGDFRVSIFGIKARKEEDL